MIKKIFKKISNKFSKLNGFWETLGYTLAIIVMIGLIFGLISIIPFLLMLIWNSVFTHLFHAPKITFWMSWGIIIFLSIISSYFKK